jgi:hypothetical protein
VAYAVPSTGGQVFPTNKIIRSIICIPTERPMGSGRVIDSDDFFHLAKKRKKSPSPTVAFDFARDRGRL